MISKKFAKLINYLPEGLLIRVAKKISYGYIKRYAKLYVNGMEKIDKIDGAKIFICNHLSNADGLILNRVLREKYDPTFVAGVKLSDDPVTSLGTKIVKHIEVKPNTADKEAIINMINILKRGENLFIFPEGTRSRSGAMIEAKKGILLIARASKAPIIPISLYGTEKLLPINESGDMAKEKWNKADVYVNFGEAIILPKKEKDELKHDYDDRCLSYIMKSIANGLPKEYRGFYK